MAGTIKTTSLPSAVALTGTEVLTIVQSNQTRQTTTLSIANLASASSTLLVVGSTPISSGNTTRVLYDNAGVLGEYAISGTGSVAMTNAPTFVTPALGTPSAAVLTNATGLPLSTGVTGNLPVTNLNSGTGASSSTFWRGDGTWAAAGTGSVTSVAQTFTGGLISVAGSPITTAGTLALTVAGTSGGIPYFSSSSTWASSGVLAANALVIGGGAGVAPSTTTTGTGVLTALGVNVGSAGAFVTFNGALGTPSSGTATNLTGLPISTGVSGLGTGVATALAVNVGSAGALVTFNGALGTPSSGTATNLTGLPLTTGVTGVLPVANGGTNASSASIAAFNNITGYSAAGATGTTSTNLVFSTSPTLVTPVLGAATGTSLSVTGALTAFSGTAIPAGGTTGSGVKVSSTSNFGLFFGSGAPTLSAAQGSIYLRSDGTSSTGVYTNTDGSTTWSAIGSDGGLTVGTTTIASGTTGRVLYDNGGVLGEALLTYSAAVLQLGAADASTATAQTLQVQSVVAGTSSVAGAAWTEIQSLSTGTGTAGTRIYQAGFALAAAAGNTVTMTIATPCVVSLASHGYVTGTPIVFTTTGALPTGITSGTTYYVVAISGSTGTFNVATSVANAIAGTLVATSGSQSGTHTGTTSATVQNPAITTATWGPSGLTGSQATSLLDLRQTWNTSGTPTAIKLNVTNVASNASALLIDLQVGGTSRLKYDISNGLRVAAAFGSLTFTSDASTGYVTSAQNLLQFQAGTGFFRLDGSGQAFKFFGGASFDLILARDAANTLAQRNSTNAQTSRVYTTYTDSSNGEWLELGSSGSIPYIAATKNGTGTQRALNLQRVATPAGGSTSAAILLGTTAAFGIYYGSGAPTVSAAKGSLYLRSDGTTTNDRAYINTDGSTTWTALTTAA